MSASPETVESPQARTAGPSVLVVDDAPLVRDMFGRYLGFAGMSVRYAIDGGEGIAAARAARPDVILCDLDLPGMSGVDMCRSLRADPTTTDVPILMVGGSEPGAFDAAVEAGCDAVLVKPCSQTLLVATIRQLLARSRTAHRA